MKKITLFLIFLVFAVYLQAQVPQSERDALIALYNATDGDNWTRNTNWNTDNPVSNWYGVYIVNINGEDHVKYLILYDNQLSGEIPPEIGNLTYLSGLYLSANQLSGEIPSEIGNLDSLTTLSLGANQLSGEIPSEIGNLSNLSSLYLYPHCIYMIIS